MFTAALLLRGDFPDRQQQQSQGLGLGHLFWVFSAEKRTWVASFNAIQTDIIVHRSDATAAVRHELEVAEGSGALRDPPKNGEDLLFTTSSTAKAKGHQMERAAAKHKSKEVQIRKCSVSSRVWAEGQGKDNEGINRVSSQSSQSRYCTGTDTQALPMGNEDEVVDTLESRDVIQRDLDRLEKWDRVNLMKFNQAKGKVLHLGQGNPKHKYRFGGE
ncbi:rna-directed dna polymerase from mobile element jockey-like [Limosa lapponica baueri]|uniref:Rna-directed dna polymerase from mobile element jockey-like n=1 Tax=Limosa lapponica baueri TaxID=1758121 RepID=A0A2I0TZI8_LIMLA|nr:rna-directed dna polymerase from mobile element jockey-like [Limosa lapponica baueri]